MITDRRVDDLLRELAPQVLTAVIRRFGRFDTAEDAVQEALLAATVQWPDEGAPHDPRAWLVTVASRRMTDELRRDEARRRREDAVAARTPSHRSTAPPADADRQVDHDDTLILLFMCCHPAVTPASRIALTLRAVGGLTTAEIARAFLVPETTMGQRISRAKLRIRSSGMPFRLPAPEERQERLRAVLHVLYLIFNEGYTATSGPALHRSELSAEAMRLTRLLHGLLPDEGEVTGLLALMVLTDARRPGRTGPGGVLIPLAEQDRSRWDRDAIAEGVTLVTETLGRSAPGPYQVQAAIAALHDEAAHADDTDWSQILALYEVLGRLVDNPMITLNRAVAEAMVHGPRTGLELLDTLGGDRRVAGHHRVDAVRAHLLELVGDRDAARTSYQAAARRTTSLPERYYLEARAARLA